MGFFDSTSTNTTKNYTSNSTETRNRQSSVAGQGEAFVVGENAEVVNTDAVSVIKETNAFLGETFNTALGFVDKAVDGSIETVNKSNNALAGELQDQKTGGATAIMGKALPLVGLGVGGFILYKVFA